MDELSVTSQNQSYPSSKQQTAGGAKEAVQELGEVFP